jgi:hypothetical protein
MNSEENNQLSPEEEIKRAQENLRSAKEKMAKLQDLKVRQVEMEIAERIATEQRRTAEAKAKHEELAEMHRQRREKEKQEREAQERSERESRMALERKLAFEEEEARQRKKHEENLAKIDAERHALEQEAARVASELFRQRNAEPEQVNASDNSEPIDGRGLLFRRLACSSHRQDGMDGHHDVTVAAIPFATPAPAEFEEAQTEVEPLDVPQADGNSRVDQDEPKDELILSDKGPVVCGRSN